MCFCETFLHYGIQDSEIQIPDFSIARSDRYSSVGSEVGVYVKNTVNFKMCRCFSNSVCGLLILKLQNPSIIIIIIYRPPSYLDCDFIYVISRAEQYILTIPAPLPNIILLGDFNFPLINWSNPNFQCPLSSPLFNLSDHLFLSQQVAKPTRNSNILDLIFSPNDLINSIDICDTFISDHRMLTVETYIPMSPPLLSPKLNPATNVFDKLDSNKANWANLISAIKQIDWSTVPDPTSSTTCLIPFTDIISQICSLHTHIKSTKKAKKVSGFLSRTENLNEKENQAKKEG